MTLTLVNWNVGWAETKKRHPEIRERIESHAPEIICLTEGRFDLLSQNGHTICSQPDWYSTKECLETEQRKVVLWSKQPWEQIDCLGSCSFLPGRFVSGITRTSLGEIFVVGICIPYVNSRTKKGKMWGADHGEYLSVLTKVLRQVPQERLIVTGDFNQIIGPGSRVGPELRKALQKALPPGMCIVTSHLEFPEGKRGVDHIALSEDLVAEYQDTISNIADDGVCLSRGHFGVIVRASTK